MVQKYIDCEDEDDDLPSTYSTYYLTFSPRNEIAS